MVSAVAEKQNLKLENRQVFNSVR